MRAYSTDLRGRILAACEGGMGTAEAAETFAVSASWVRRIKQRYRDEGEVAPAPRPAAGRPRPSTGRTTASAARSGTTPG